MWRDHIVQTKILHYKGGSFPTAWWLLQDRPGWAKAPTDCPEHSSLPQL